MSDQATAGGATLTGTASGPPLHLDYAYGTFMWAELEPVLARWGAREWGTGDDAELVLGLLKDLDRHLRRKAPSARDQVRNEMIGLAAVVLLDLYCLGEPAGLADWTHQRERAAS